MQDFPHHVYILDILALCGAARLYQERYKVVNNKHVRIDTDSMSPTCAVDIFDHALEYMHEHFPRPEKTDEVFKMDVNDCNALLCMPMDEFVAKLKTLPPYFRDTLFPIAVARYILREAWMPVDHRKMQQWREFHNRYGAIVLSY